MLNKDSLFQLSNTLPGKITTSTNEIQKHSSNLFYINNFLPEAICYAESTEDVLSLVNFCIHKKIPIIPFGSGTSVEGHTAAVHGGICLNLSKMDKILEFQPEDGYVVVQPGVPYNKLNDYLDPHGYYFPVEAGWGASIGGMMATNASGAGAMDSGSMSKNILTCEVVAYKNQQACRIKTGTKSLKSSAGYNLTSLYVGSEGTLGVITEITLKIRKKFASHNTVCCQFDNIKDAVDFVASLKGISEFRRVELLDKHQTNACIAYSKVNFLKSSMNTIIAELAGNEFAVLDAVRIINNYLLKVRAENIKVFPSKETAEEVWVMRKNACHAAINYINKNKKAMATDVCVPLSKLSDCIHACYKHMSRLKINAPLVAHIGDGNFHFTILVDPENNSELQNALAFNKVVVEEALNFCGTCTGEHGIGIGKKEYLKAEHGDSLVIMKMIKNALDPLNIFNPGKIFNLEQHSSFFSE